VVNVAQLEKDTILVCYDSESLAHADSHYLVYFNVLAMKMK